MFYVGEESWHKSPVLNCCFNLECSVFGRHTGHEKASMWQWKKPELSFWLLCVRWSVRLDWLRWPILTVVHSGIQVLGVSETNWLIFKSVTSRQRKTPSSNTAGRTLTDKTSPPPKQQSRQLLEKNHNVIFKHQSLEIFRLQSKTDLNNKKFVYKYRSYCMILLPERSRHVCSRCSNRIQSGCQCWWSYTRVKFVFRFC